MKVDSPISVDIIQWNSIRLPIAIYGGQDAMLKVADQSPIYRNLLQINDFF